MFCVDDKCIIPIGDPECAISTGVRSHNASLVPIHSSLGALDHDYHVHGAVPSVTLKVETPDCVEDSFYKGQIHVTVKDKVFEPSHAFRHAVELVKIIRNTYSEDGVNSGKPILFVYSDGGPDHRTTFKSVQIAAVYMFIALDLDMYVAARTAPGQSYVNPAERTMACLNLALQNVALEREAIPDETMERRAKSLKSLKQTREASERNSVLKAAITDSVRPVLNLLRERFKRLKYSGNEVLVEDAVPDETIKFEFCSLIEILEDGMVEYKSLESADFEALPGLKRFMEEHCRKRQYTYQIKKCKRDDCTYCTINPVRAPADIFNDLHWLPDPQFDNDKSKLFSEIYGQDTTDANRPSLQQKLGKNTADVANKPLLVAG